MNGEQPGTSVPPPEPGPAPDAPASLRDRLDEAFRSAGVEASTHTGPTDTAVSVTLYTRIPALATTPEDATAWLREHDIDADARFEDVSFHLVIDLHTSQAVDRFTDLVLAPHIRTRAAADALAKVLEPLKLSFSLRADTATHTIDLALHDNADVRSAQTLAGLLGAPGLDEGLDLIRIKHLRRLADRFAWLVTGVTGSSVRAEAQPDCACSPDQLTLSLTPDQARLLTDRLTAGPA